MTMSDNRGVSVRGFGYVPSKTPSTCVMTLPALISETAGEHKDLAFLLYVTGRTPGPVPRPQNGLRTCPQRH